MACLASIPPPPDESTGGGGGDIGNILLNQK